MTKTKPNWTAAYTAFCQGAGLAEISTAFDIPMASLQQKASVDGWATLRSTMPIGDLVVLARPKAGEVVPAPDGAAPDGDEPEDLDLRSPATKALALRNQYGLARLSLHAERRLAQIRDHRDSNFQAAQAMQDDLMQDLLALREGRLKSRRLFFSSKTNTVTEHVTDLTWDDKVKLATFAKLVADLGYRALGDVVPAEGKSDQGPGAQAQPSQAITIILPAVIQKPREEREMPRLNVLPEVRPEPAAMPAIDIESTTTAAPTPLPNL